MTALAAKKQVIEICLLFTIIKQVEVKKRKKSKGNSGILPEG